jgi:hypothetical protein
MKRRRKIMNKSQLNYIYKKTNNIYKISDNIISEDYNILNDVNNYLKDLNIFLKKLNVKNSAELGVKYLSKYVKMFNYYKKLNEKEQLIYIAKNMKY